MLHEVINRSPKSVVYLHGFASDPQSIKAQYFARLLAPLPFVAPDLNQPDFPSITVSRMADAAGAALVSAAAPVALFGSSMGGYAATLAAQRHPDRVGALILFAPAFDLDALWHSRLTEAQRAAWQATDHLPVGDEHPRGHPAYLRYTIFEDAVRLRSEALRAVVPTLIFHGAADTTVPLLSSEAFAARESEVELVVFAGAEHGLNDKLEIMGERVQRFLFGH